MYMMYIMQMMYIQEDYVVYTRSYCKHNNTKIMQKYNVEYAENIIGVQC